MRRHHIWRCLRHQCRYLATEACPVTPTRVPLVPQKMHDQLFPKGKRDTFSKVSQAAIDISLKHLRDNGLLDDGEAKNAEGPSFDLPELQGSSIREHFVNISNYMISDYLRIAQHLSRAKIPRRPTTHEWRRIPGWTRYTRKRGSWVYESVPFPDEDAVIFDIESMIYQTGHYPCMAVAVGEAHWYSWTSPWLTGDSPSVEHLVPFGPVVKDGSGDTSALRANEAQTPRIIVGHNVAFDRARISTEYSLKNDKTRFLDTMALHTAISGLSNPQRVVFASYENGKESTRDKMLFIAPWLGKTSKNGLSDAVKLHLGKTLDKEAREFFTNPIMRRQDAYDQFHNLLDYCASDCAATFELYKAVFKKYLYNCPHPSTFLGILAMSKPFLPVNEKWPKYIEAADQVYLDTLVNIQSSLDQIIEDTRVLGSDQYENDPWLRQLDWTLKPARRGALPLEERARVRRENLLEELYDSVGPEASIRGNGPDQEDASMALRCPQWYAKLVEFQHSKEYSVDTSSTYARSVILTLMKPRLNGFPLIHHPTGGWLVAVPENAPPEALEECRLFFRSNYAANGTLSDNALYYVPFIMKHFEMTGDELRESGFLDATPKRTSTFLRHSGVPLHMYSEGLLTSDEHQDLLDKFFSGQDVLEDFETLIRQASFTPQDEAVTDPWFSLLNWDTSYVVAKYGNGKEESETALDNEDEEASNSFRLEDSMWPQWYHDLYEPRKQQISISMNQRIVPLLLKLSWKGYPLAYSKQYKWLYAVPAADAEAMMHDTVMNPVSLSDPADHALFDFDGTYFMLPHPSGKSQPVGSPLGKTFNASMEDWTLTSESPLVRNILEANASCSYWKGNRERIISQMVVWDKDENGDDGKQRGLILPQVVTMGTITRRSVERTWLTASNAKKSRLGSELKSLVEAPPGYAIVGADVDSEELWIASVFGDAQFGIHGATALGYQTLEGSKSAGTDMHSSTARIIGTSRDNAKIFNYSRIYGAGVKHAVDLLLQTNPGMDRKMAFEQAKKLYHSTKGIHAQVHGTKLWCGGSESFVFNALEAVALEKKPFTPVLGAHITQALAPENMPDQNLKGSKLAAEDSETLYSQFMTSRVNWVVQSSGVDYLHLLIVSMEYLIDRFDIDARYMLSVHDEIRYLVKEEDKYRAALAFQIATTWTRTMFSYSIQMRSLPESVAFFSCVDIDHVFRKEVDMDCVTPSQPDPIPPGESLDIMQVLDKTGGSLFEDGSPMSKESELPRITDQVRTLKPQLKDTRLRLFRESNIEKLRIQAGYR